MIREICMPLSTEVIHTLHAGERILLSGVVYTARDAAHKRFMETLDRQEKLPFELAGNAIYFAGPCPAKPGRVIGSCGPTTSARMDAYSPRLILECGLSAMIGKGNRSAGVIAAMKKGPCVYFAATGGAGALIARHIVKSEVIAYDDLGAEAVRRLEVYRWPLVVVIDCEGHNLYERNERS
ncbi:MAG: Fe-S-containing hydro-lyase [Victivallaceae bacterium]|nr:Fe-S-containing hydro-lyase [Victivallaceae bacterium]